MTDDDGIDWLPLAWTDPEPEEGIDWLPFALGWLAGLVVIVVALTVLAIR